MRAPRRIAAAVSLGLAATVATAAMATAAQFAPRANPVTYDPGNLGIIKAKWQAGKGLNDSPGKILAVDLKLAGIQISLTLLGSSQQKYGLVLEKNGPTTANAAAFAEIKGVQGITLNTLGFDIKSNTHCGGGAPRFNVQTTTGFFFVGNCSLASYTSLGGGWSRVRMTAANIFPPVASLADMGTIQSIDIAFDEGTDTPPGGLIVTPGKTVIDNIAINNKLITKPGPA